MTDHSSCIEFHSNSFAGCERNQAPYGDWASAGLYASKATSITLRDLNIHGLAAKGIWAGGLLDWTLERVRLAGNGWVGWDGDLGSSLSSNQGYLSFSNCLVEWNGCGETYPGEAPHNCWGQSAGGYGDGLGTAATGGQWLIHDSVFRYNTSDGLDLLYVRDANSRIEVKRSQFYSNAGDQLKTNGPVSIENSLLLSQCGFFEKKPFTYHVDHCRAGGSALAITLRKGVRVSLVQSVLAGQGDCLGIIECADGSCDGSETIVIQNCIFQGYQEFLDPTDQTCLFWFDQDQLYTRQLDYNLIFETKMGSFIPSTHDIVADPQFLNPDIEAFDAHLRSISPGINTGLGLDGSGGLLPDHDLEGKKRPWGSGVDRGVYEFRGNGWGASLLLLLGTGE